MVLMDIIAWIKTPASPSREPECLIEDSIALEKSAQKKYLSWIKKR